eukprot:gene21108-27996_t
MAANCLVDALPAAAGLERKAGSAKGRHMRSAKGRESIEEYLTIGPVKDVGLLDAILDVISADPLGPAPLEGKKRIDNLYSIMGSIENKLGGGEGIEGIYGSVTQTGMQKVLDSMRYNTGLGKGSTMVDIGAGLGRPLLHALLDPGVAGTFGIELDHVKVAKARAFLKQVDSGLSKRGVELTSGGRDLPTIYQSSIEEFKSLEPATHAYSFWEGVPYSGKKAFGRLFASSTTLRAVAVVQRAMPRGVRPEETMAELHFGPLMLISNFPVKMSGSGRSFQAYVFSKPHTKAQQFFNQIDLKPSSPAEASTAGGTQVYAPAPIYYDAAGAQSEVSSDPCPSHGKDNQATAVGVDAPTSIGHDDNGGGDDIQCGRDQGVSGGVKGKAGKGKGKGGVEKKATAVTAEVSRKTSASRSQGLPPAVDVAQVDEASASATGTQGARGGQGKSDDGSPKKALLRPESKSPDSPPKRTRSDELTQPQPSQGTSATERVVVKEEAAAGVGARSSRRLAAKSIASQLSQC